MADCSSCKDKSCPSQARQPEESEQEYAQRCALSSRLCRIKEKLVVLSGKGGVGKSTVAVNLAIALAKKGKQVGLLDVDVHGPSIPTLLNLEGHQVVGDGDGVEPLSCNGVKVMSVGFLLQDESEAVIWRGPAKYGVIKQFLSTVNWGDLDCLIVDCPPGTGDEPLSVMQIIKDVDGAIVVTTPQNLALCDVRRSITFCRRLEVPVVGVIENMSGFVCPHCGEKVDIFKSGGSKAMAEEMDVEFLGAIPLGPEIVQSCDAGTPVVLDESDSTIVKAFNGVLEKTLAKSSKELEK